MRHFGFEAQAPGIEVNDAQSKLNRTIVSEVASPSSIDQIRKILRDAQRSGNPVCAAGCLHAMGQQQFGSGAILLDMKRFNRVVKFDRLRGIIEVESGIEWPDLIGFLHEIQRESERTWAIKQKQTGVDRVSIGGSLSANIHGRGLRFPPFINDIESFDLIDANGNVNTCSRTENEELFLLAIGGYGLFGIVANVRLRLVPRTKVERIVKLIAVKDLLPLVDLRLQEGYVFGDCQFSIDLSGDAAEHPGVFSCYRPAREETPISSDAKQLSGSDWSGLYKLARTDKMKAFELYSGYYLSSSGQVYWSDSHQLSSVFDGYSEAVDDRLGTEMITEVYVKRDDFLPFLAKVREDFLDQEVDMMYGTIRFIEKDSESFLAWAREAYVCIVCNLHVAHGEEGLAKAKRDFRRIIDRAVEFGGSYYLTYHRWAKREHIDACYPQFCEFLRLKRKYDPRERFQSDWYRHYRDMFAESI